MTKILVYGKTVREARNYVKPKSGIAIGARVYADYDNGEKYDERIVIDETKIKKPKKKAKEKDGV